MNGKACCILGVCCPPGSAAQRDALAAELVADHIVDEAGAQKAAAWMLSHFDLAPAGSLLQFKADVAKLARGPQARA